MNEKKTLSISITSLLLVIAIILIVIMTYFLYTMKIEKQNAISKNTDSEEQIATLKNELSTLQTKLESVSNTLNTNTTTEETTTTETEKQSIDADGYTITLYSDNTVKLTPILKDLQTIFGSTTIEGLEKNYIVIGFLEKVEKMYQANNGLGVDPITFFIMKDGTVEYIQPLSQIINNNNIIPDSFKVDGKIDNLNNVVDLKTNSSEVIIAVTKDGQEINIWNEGIE